jgi:NhaA family Na+:H+ antiporter
MPNLYASLVMLVVLIIFNILGIRKPSLYLFTGVVMWLAMLDSGIHATLTGILVAATVPARPKRESRWFIQTASNLMHRFEHIENQKDDSSPILGEDEQHDVVENVQQAAEKATTPLRRWERALEHPVSLFVMPIFALANAGISMEMYTLPVMLTEPLAIGIVLGLLIGKGVGIPLFTFLALRMNLGQLPNGLDMRHVIGLGLLGGMGFTMSIFISNLGFENTPETLVIAKTAILLASFIAGISGYLWLRVRN